MDSIQPGKTECLRKTFRSSHVHLLIVALLAAFTAGGCGGGSDGATDSTSDPNQCLFQPGAATNATFGRSLVSNRLELQVDSTDANGYSIDFCVAKPHTAGIRGISADVNLGSTSANEADVNILLSPYQSSNGTYLFTEVYIAQNGDLRWAVERCDTEDNCSTLQASTNRQTGTLSLSTVYNLSIAWNGSTTLTYGLSGGATDSCTYTIDTVANPIINDQLTTSEVAIGLFTSSTGGVVSSVGQFDNVLLSTDGTTFTSYDTFTGTDDPYTGGTNWAFIEGID